MLSIGSRGEMSLLGDLNDRPVWKDEILGGIRGQVRKAPGLDGITPELLQV